jgi:DNA-binding SARP family transcriptional activator
MVEGAGPKVRVQLFGQFQIWVDGVPSKLSAPPKGLPLLAYLILHAKQAVSRDALAFTMWPDDTEEHARANLRRHLHYLSRAQPANDDQPWLVVDAERVQWNTRADAWVDVLEFERLVALPHGRSQSVDLYAGDLLEELYDDWLFAPRERLRNAYLAALAELVVDCRSRRDLLDAQRYAQLILAHDPWREDALRHLMTLRYERGDRSGALKSFAEFRNRLRQEMAVDPMPETLALHDAIVHNAPLIDSQVHVEIDTERASRRGLLMPFVGRGAEVEQLRAFWSRAARGRGSLALVSGEAGIGKTRLVSELALLVESEGGRVAFGTTGYPESSPYQSIAGALRSTLPLLASSELNPIWLAAVAQIIPELAARRPELPELPVTDPHRDRLRLFEGIAAAFEVLAKSRPLLLVLEDVHWDGEATLAALAFLTRRAVGSTILVVATYRDEEAPRTHPLRRLRRELASEHVVSSVAPQRLIPAAVAELVRSMPALAESGESVSASLHEQSEGNPLFLAQLIDDVLDAKSEGAAAGSAAIGAQPAAHIGIRKTIASRLTRLSQSARTLGDLAAVVGQGFDVEVLSELSGWDQQPIYDGLHELQDRHVVRESTGQSGDSYAFTHHLIQATLYDELPANVRTRRHARVAQVLEDMNPGKGEIAHEIARHYDLGGVAARAAVQYVAAGTHAI